MRAADRLTFTAFAAMAFALLCAPWVFTSGLALSVLSQMGYAIIICLSYNLLFGQGGMLSFGHAVYSGLGAFAAVHAIQWATQGGWQIPLVFMPLVGGMAGMLCAAVLGFINTRRAGTTFAMITLGIGELVAAIALMFPRVFGGEGGIGINRVYGTAWMGLSFGPAIQVYYLIAVWCMLCAIAMYGFTRTPLGLMLNAVRDNPMRAGFVGYNPRRVRHLAFVVAGFFAGIGGALMAIHLEIVTGADSLGMARSGATLLFTFMGGAGFFFGPVIGAVLMVCSTVLLSHLTPAWLLYLGLGFVLMVMFAPGGIAGLLHDAVRAWQTGRARVNGAQWALRTAGVLLVAVGGSALVEMLYHLQMDSDFDPTLQFLRVTLDVKNTAHWVLASIAWLGGVGVLVLARSRGRARTGRAP